jgi:energy-coupling factor transport system ATP-binding protein
MSIEIRNLSYTYMKGSPFQKTALKDINIKISKGEFVGIIGPTGSGKSTLIQHFNGLLKPESGKVIINGMDVSGRNLKELRKQVGIVFQYPEHQLFDETVYKDVSFGLVKQGASDSYIKKQVLKSIKAVGLEEDILEKSPFELSGGQKRRVAIAGVIAMEPGILILDEPTAGLDPRGRDSIYSLILRLHKEQGMTIILVSHSMEDIARLAQRVIVLNNGMIEMEGTVKEVFRESRRLEEIGLSVPQISHLMKRLKGFIPGINEDIFTIEDAKKELMKYL